jgi:hypothetical protein
MKSSNLLMPTPPSQPLGAAITSPTPSPGVTAAMHAARPLGAPAVAKTATEGQAPVPGLANAPQRRSNHTRHPSTGKFIKGSKGRFG